MRVPGTEEKDTVDNSRNKTEQENKSRSEKVREHGEYKTQEQTV